MLRRRCEGDEHGFTLVELLVVITILTIVGGIVTTTVVSSIRASHRAQQRAESLAALQNTLQRVGRELRAADPIVIDTGVDVRRQISAEVHRGGQVHKMTYYIDARGDLVEDRVIEDAAGNVVEEVQGRLLASDIVVDNVTFRYFDDVFTEDGTGTGDEITCAGSDGIVLDTESTCVAEYRGAEFIEITVETDLIRTADQEILTLINLRNEIVS